MGKNAGVLGGFSRVLGWGNADKCFNEAVYRVRPPLIHAEKNNSAVFLNVFLNMTRFGGFFMITTNWQMSHPVRASYKLKKIDEKIDGVILVIIIGVSDAERNVR